MARVLITSGWLRSSYAVLRNLKKHNFEVFVADAVTVGMCQFSLKKNGFDLYTSHYISETQFISDIIRICKKRNIDVLIPSHDETEILPSIKVNFPKNSVLFYQSLINALILIISPNHMKLRCLMVCRCRNGSITI